VDRSEHLEDPFSVSPWVNKEDAGSGYKNRIKALGNSIVPQVAYQIFKAMSYMSQEVKTHQETS
jgi:hypothetical protein